MDLIVDFGFAYILVISAILVQFKKKIYPGSHFLLHWAGLQNFLKIHGILKLNNTKPHTALTRTVLRLILEDMLT